MPRRKRDTKMKNLMTLGVLGIAVGRAARRLEAATEAGDADAVTQAERDLAEAEGRLSARRTELREAAAAVKEAKRQRLEARTAAAQLFGLLSSAQPA